MHHQKSDSQEGAFDGKRVVTKATPRREIPSYHQQDIPLRSTKLWKALFVGFHRELSGRLDDALTEPNPTCS